MKNLVKEWLHNPIWYKYSQSHFDLAPASAGPWACQQAAAAPARHTTIIILD